MIAANCPLERGIGDVERDGDDIKFNRGRQLAGRNDVVRLGHARLAVAESHSSKGASGLGTPHCSETEAVFRD